MSGPGDRLNALETLLPGTLGRELIPHARLVTLRPNQIVIGHQDRSSDVYVVIEGSLTVELVSLNGREIVLADLAAGEIFGDFAALDDQPRSASVEAASDCLLACIPGDVFTDAVFASPETAEWFARRLVRQIRLLTERVFELNALAVRSRLHCELLRLCLAAGIADNRALIARLPTHGHLASRIGTHREAVTREMQYLQKQGIVEQRGRALAIGDVARLAEIVRAAAGDVDILHHPGLERR